MGFCSNTYLPFGPKSRFTLFLGGRPLLINATQLSRPNNYATQAMEGAFYSMESYIYLTVQIKTRTTIVVSNGSYTFYQIPIIQCLLSNTIYQIPFIKYHWSNNIYQIPFIKYHLSNTIYQIPFIKYILSNNVNQIPFIKYHLQSNFFF